MAAIKDMEMPSCCFACDLYVDELCIRTGSFLSNSVSDTKRMNDCPLVEIGTCKDCEKNKGLCLKFLKEVKDDFYCADFERKK